MRRSTMLLSHALSCKLRSRGECQEEPITTGCRRRQAEAKRDGQVQSPCQTQGVSPRVLSPNHPRATLVCSGRLVLTADPRNKTFPRATTSCSNLRVPSYHGPK